MSYENINNTGHTVSDILDNDELSFYAEIQERLCLGQEATIYKIITEIIGTYGSRW